MSSSASEGDKRKGTQARSQQRNTICLYFSGNMALYQRLNKVKGPFLVQTRARDITQHTLAHISHWPKRWTHTESGICVALRTVAKAVKWNHGRRNVRFPQRTQNNIYYVHSGCEISERIFVLFWQMNAFITSRCATWALSKPRNTDCKWSLITPEIRQGATHFTDVWWTLADNGTLCNSMCISSVYYPQTYKLIYTPHLACQRLLCVQNWNSIKSKLLLNRPNDKKQLAPKFHCQSTRAKRRH